MRALLRKPRQGCRLLHDFAPFWQLRWRWEPHTPSSGAAPFVCASLSVPLSCVTSSPPSHLLDQLGGVPPSGRPVLGSLTKPQPPVQLLEMSAVNKGATALAKTLLLLLVSSGTVL